MKEVSARLADSDDVNRLDMGRYQVVKSEVGNVFLKEGDLVCRENISLGLSKFLWMQSLTVKGIVPA